jgi:dihydroorotate dehydrogenase (NAD+) catalytic subunit
MRVMEKLRSVTDVPLWAKLTPNTGETVEVAKAAEEAGADALVVANTILAMQIDVNTYKPSLGNIMGGLSGPAIKPIALRMVYQCFKVVGIPVIGCGGIASVEDTVEFLLAGAAAVQVGTATFINPSTMKTIIADLAGYCDQRGIGKITDLIGKVDDENALDETVLMEVDI